MNKMQLAVRAFHKLFDYPTSPNAPEMRSAELRANLIIEEAIETAVALVGSARAQTVVQHQLVKVLQSAAQAKMTEPNLAEAIDGVCDCLYVLFGTAEDFGIDIEPFFDEVHSANMRKANGPIFADGKIGKPPEWTGPNIVALLDKVRCGDL